MNRPTVLFIVLLTAVSASPVVVADSPQPASNVFQKLAPFIECLTGKRESFTLTAGATIVDGDKSHEVTARFARIDADSFDLDIKHQDYWLKLYRRADRTALILPKHQTAFVGEGAVRGEDTVSPLGISSRLIGPGTVIALYWPMITANDPAVVLSALEMLLPLKQDQDTNTYRIGESISITFAADSNGFDLKVNDVTAHVTLTDAILPVDIDSELVNTKPVGLDRAEIERYLARGVRRALEVLAPSPMLTRPVQRDRRVPHGELRWIDGHRVVLLSGTPEQIGRAHGELLKQETVRCIDSVIHMFALARTIESGRWFKHDLDAAYQRLQPHIPADHTLETVALADAIGWDRDLVKAVNVFPELFHCSGFAVFDSATKDGTLYHGRVLDYMTTIGLQDSATTFIVAVDGKIPFANVGYAGFIGSVSGMNAQSISLGEMGGRRRRTMGRRAHGDLDAPRTGRMQHVGRSQSFVDQ